MLNKWSFMYKKKVYTFYIFNLNVFLTFKYFLFNGQNCSFKRIEIFLHKFLNYNKLFCDFVYFKFHYLLCNVLAFSFNIHLTFLE